MVNLVITMMEDYGIVICAEKVDARKENSLHIVFAQDAADL